MQKKNKISFLGGPTTPTYSTKVRERSHTYDGSLWQHSAATQKDISKQNLTWNKLRLARNSHQKAKPGERDRERLTNSIVTKTLYCRYLKQSISNNQKLTPWNIIWFAHPYRKVKWLGHTPKEWGQWHRHTDTQKLQLIESTGQVAKLKLTSTIFLHLDLVKINGKFLQGLVIVWYIL